MRSARAGSSARRVDTSVGRTLVEPSVVVPVAGAGEIDHPVPVQVAEDRDGLAELIVGLQVGEEATLGVADLHEALDRARTELGRAWELQAPERERERGEEPAKRRDEPPHS